MYNAALMLLDLRVGFTSNVVMGAQEITATKGFEGLDKEKRQCSLREELPEFDTLGKDLM